MKQKKNTENTLDLGIDVSKVNLIRHFMAEKGLDSEQFDKEFKEQVQKLVEKMYHKYVPANVRKLFETPAFSISVNPTISKPQEEDIKEDNNGQSEALRNDT